MPDNDDLGRRSIAFGLSGSGIGQRRLQFPSVPGVAIAINRIQPFVLNTDNVIIAQHASMWLTGDHSRDAPLSDEQHRDIWAVFEL